MCGIRKERKMSEEYKMNTRLEEKVIKSKIGLLELAQHLGSVSQNLSENKI
jgi:hypothetical protein